jgi:hypothetical protein
MLSWQITDRCRAEAAVAALCCLVPVAHALAVRATFLGYREEFSVVHVTVVSGRAHGLGVAALASVTRPAREAGA